MANLSVGEFLGDLLERVRPGEADGDDRVEALAGEVAERLFALGVVLDLEVAIGDAGLLLELLGAVEGRLVERLVELAADVVDDRRLRQRARAAVPRARAAAAPITIRFIGFPALLWLHEQSPAGTPYRPGRPAWGEHPARKTPDWLRFARPFAIFMRFLSKLEKNPQTLLFVFSLPRDPHYHWRRHWLSRG